ncbi:capsular biosynthesis protein [Clostridiales bacterium S5-A14a]|nr:capsular biosynthesis protein [Clostridiales bacterium S5-A14a]
MNIPFSPPDISETEIQEVVSALKSGWITTGPKTKEFERQIKSYIGVDGCACLNSATAAMELTLRLLGVGPGDEVITSAYTYTATASVIDHVGAKIVFLDTAKDSFEMDYDRLGEAITSKTKVIMPVDLAGKICDYDRIYDIINEKKSIFQPSNKLQKSIGRITILADSAHGFGAEKRGLRSGNFADFTSFSFHAVKNLTTAEGGAVVWKSIEGIEDEWIYNQYMLASLHGQSKDALAKTKLGAWEYDILYPAYKCNMTDINAAIGLKQLERYDGLLARRKEIIEKYDKAFLDSGLMPLKHFDSDSKSSGHLYLLRIPGFDVEMRNELIKKLAEKTIATNVHYKPLPMMSAYKNFGFDIKDYPNAYEMYENEITLPLHTKLTDEQVDYIIDNTLQILKDLEK